MPAEGYLIIRPVGRVVARYAPEPLGSHWKEDIGGAGTEYVPADPYDRNKQNNPHHNDEVRFVQVDIYHQNGTYLGSIYVTGKNPGDKVKPKHVARAIEKIVKEGGT